MVWYCDSIYMNLYVMLMKINGGYRTTLALGVEK